MRYNYNIYDDYFTFRGNKYLIKSVVELNENGVKRFKCKQTQLVEHYYTYDHQEYWKYVVDSSCESLFTKEPKTNITTIPPDKLINKITIPAEYSKKIKKHNDNVNNNNLIFLWFFLFVGIVLSFVLCNPGLLILYMLIQFFIARNNSIKELKSKCDFDYGFEKKYKKTIYK